MKRIIFVCTLLCILLSGSLYAQLPPVRHASAEVKEKQRERADYKEFRKQIMLLKEFSDEKKKIPKLQKDSKEVVKVLATIDSTDGGDEVKTITGYITQQIGENNVNAYELLFDRATRKITSIKKTGDATEPEVAEAKEKTVAKPKAAPAKKKKSDDGDDEEEDDEPEEKPSKTTKKEDAE